MTKTARKQVETARKQILQAASNVNEARFMASEDERAELHAVDKQLREIYARLSNVS